MANKAKMFVHFNGTKAEFIAQNLPESYASKIVFINGIGKDGAGEQCIYTHGEYYGNVKEAEEALKARLLTAEGKISANEGAIKANDDAIKALKYFSKISDGKTSATVASANGTITIKGIEGQAVTTLVDETGINIGLNEDFISKVNTASEKAEAAAVKSEVDTAIGELQGADVSLGNRIATLEGMVGLESGGEGASLDTRLTAAEGEIDALQLLVGTGTVDTRIATAKGEAATDALGKADAAESAAKLYADGLNTSMNARMESAEGSISTLTGAGEGSVTKALADAKAYTDTEIGKVNSAASALEGRVQSNEEAILTLNGADTVNGSVAKAVKDGINDFATKLSDNQTIDTFKELVDYAASHTSEYATLAGEVQSNTNAISTLNGSAEEAGSVAKQVKDAVNAEAAIARAAEQANAGAIADEATEARKQEGLIREEFVAADAKVLKDAKDYADGLASNYDAAGSATTAESNAKAYAKEYADGLAGNYDEAGAAAAVDAKLTTEVNRAKAAEKVNADAIAAIVADYLKAADKATLEGLINGKVAQADYNEKMLALEAKDAELAGFWSWEEIPALA